MTEAEWLACTDPAPMLEFLRGKASERKLRLFACACIRPVLRWLEGRPSARAVEVAERFADGLASQEDMAAEVSAARDDTWELVGLAAFNLVQGIESLWQVSTLVENGEAG